METALLRLVVPAPVAVLNSGEAALFTALKFKPMFRELAWYCGWLNRLKKSNWNCIFTRSVSLKFFRKDKSTSLLPGPWQMPTPALPSWPICNPFTVKALGLNHCRPLLLLPRQDWPETRSGRCLPLSPIPAKSFPRTGVMEGPEEQFMLELRSQSPAPWRRHDFLFS